MPSLARQAVLMPFWLAQVFTQEKFFARNPIIGNRWLNQHGLHAARVVAAWRLPGVRRGRVGRVIAAPSSAADLRRGSPATRSRRLYHQARLSATRRLR